MADEPDNMILKLLREVRSAQDDHNERLRHIETQIDEIVGWAKARPATSSSSGLRRAHRNLQLVGTSVPTLQADANGARP